MKCKNILKASLCVVCFLANISHASEYQDRYETIEGQNITVNDSYSESDIDISIEGNTYINILKNVEWAPRESYLYNNNIGNYDISGQTITMINYSNKPLNLTLNSDGKVGFDGIYSRTVVIPANSYVVEKINSDEKLRTFTALLSAGWNQDTDSNKVMDKLVVMIGDYSDKPLPGEYFEGIKSVGEDENFKLKVNNKNLFNPKILKIDAVNGGHNGGYIKSFKNGEVTVATKNTQSSGQESYTYAGNCVVQLKPNTEYYISYKTDGVYGIDHGTDTVEVFITHVKNDMDNYSVINSVAPSGLKFTTNELGLVGLRFDINDGVSEHKFYDIQINEFNGDNKYNENYQQLFELNNINLRKISDEVKDKIIKKNGQWYIERNCTQIKYDGSSDENWIISSENNDSITTMFYIRTPDRLQFSEGVSSSYNILDSYVHGNPEGIYYGEDFNIRIANEKLETLDLDGFRKYLAQNPFEVVYQLSEPKYEKLKIPLDVTLYDEITHIFADSVIPCDIKITVDRAANIAKEAINRALNNPSAENLSNARYWTNLLKESTLKDSFQNQINNNTNVLDMNIEKKSASANADVYVKLKNTLSLSLDTNNIIFDDVDSTQDTELKNAVNLTVSSSLPYRVNAYLEGEIYNSDKTATLDKSTLNIKVSGDGNYKAFSSTTDPILLVDNHNEGVDISHGLDFMLSGGNTHKADVYKTTIKIEVEQK